MKRRDFLASAVAAALAPVAFARKPSALYDLIEVPPAGPVLSPATYTWWHNHDEDQIDSLFEPELGDLPEMERLWKECLSYPAPELLTVDLETYRLVRKHLPEWFT